ncbi:MAG TPA: TIGR02117 family protein [Burkholderiales bacterium]|jgi:uncharacterized protein (TIGR02117 family)
MKRAFKAGAALPALGVAGVLAYALCALALGAISVNRDYRAPASGITIYLQHNGVHTDLLLPVQAAQIDWRGDFPARDFAAPVKPLNVPLALDPGIPPDRNPAAAYVAIGWGDRGFYFDTPTWADLTAATALKALSGAGPSVLHVEYVPVPASTPGLAPNLRRLVLTPAAYARLAAHVKAAFANDAHGAHVAYPGRGYTPHDTFYAARGHFSPILTCNEWVREALAAAGVRVPAWAPLRYALFD